jgi:drug/metabolite transporter (DMT)-like permease
LSVTALSLVVLAGLLHALWNIAAKKAGGDARFACFTAAATLVIWAPVGIGMGWDVLAQWGVWEWSMVLASGVLHVLYFVVLLRGYRHADLTVVYPLARGSGPLLSSCVAVGWLGESLSTLGAFGIAGVLVGVFLIAGGPTLFAKTLRTDADSVAHDMTRRLRQAGVRYGLLTGVCIACYTVVDGYAVKVLLMSPVLAHYFESLVRCVLLAPTVLQNRTAARQLWCQQWRYVWVVSVLSPVSYVLVLYAMQTAPLSLVAPAREVSMLFAALIGGHLLGEGDRWLRLVGALLIAAGVILLGVA